MISYNCKKIFKENRLLSVVFFIVSFLSIYALADQFDMEIKFINFLTLSFSSIFTTRVFFTVLVILIFRNFSDKKMMCEVVRYRSLYEYNKVRFFKMVLISFFAVFFITINTLIIYIIKFNGNNFFSFEVLDGLRFATAGIHYFTGLVFLGILIELISIRFKVKDFIIGFIIFFLILITIDINFYESIDMFYIVNVGEYLCLLPALSFENKVYRFLYLLFVKFIIIFLYFKNDLIRKYS